MTRLKLVPATIAHLVALQSDSAAFGDLIGSPVPKGWPEFPESVDFTLDRLRAHPDEADWWMHFFLADSTLVGSGGFTGLPSQRTVEIGYEIAPQFRGRGFATAAAAQLIDKARRSGGVDAVIAHTLAEHNPSTGVLRKLGFEWAGEVPDPEQGTVWRWRLPLTA